MKVYEKNWKREFTKGMLFILVFVIWTALIRLVDVQPLGVNGTPIGFATFNVWFHQFTGVHMSIYNITDWLGLVPIVVCLLFGGLGFMQLMKRKSLFKVDRDIIVLGIYYVVVIMVYVLFEMLPINYRPVLIDGMMEVSYPSSTTLLVLCVMPTLIEQSERRLKYVDIRRMVKVLTIGFSIFMVVGRLYSGVHWFTDIAGGILLSKGLFCLYKAGIMLSVDIEDKELEN